MRDKKRKEMAANSYNDDKNTIVKTHSPNML